MEKLFPLPLIILNKHSNHTQLIVNFFQKNRIIMKRTYLLFFSLFICLLVFSSKNTEAQTVELLAGNTLNGALQGTILGGATMGLYNTSDFAYLRVGLGLGTLYGVGMGAYDVTVSGGRDLVVSGLFNDGNNSSIIVLLDTFYGAAVGSIIVTSVMLVANNPIKEGLQYGAAVGAWVGFGFGVFDTVMLAKRTTGPSIAAYTPVTNASGFLGLSFDNGTSLGFINPTLIQTKSADFNSSISPAIDVMNLRVNF